MEPHAIENSPNASQTTTAGQLERGDGKDNGYQDATESRDSKLKELWDAQMVDLKSKNVLSYRKGYVLLLSWHESVDDLKTAEEVASLDRLFRNKFNYETCPKTITKDPRRSAQAQVNRYLAEFVDDYDDINTLLIVYYAGHGRPGTSQGGLHLAGSRSFRPEDEFHEIVWSSAEHNIKSTKGDVLVIFDCCHAGELERSVRSPFSRRAFEFLAATSAKSTTPSPGPSSFTSALMWSLNHLADSQGSFSTQELLRTIAHDAPNFPQDQSPRLCEPSPVCLRKIIIAPLSGNESTTNFEVGDRDNNHDIQEDVSVRFIYTKQISEDVVKELTLALVGLVKGGTIDVQDLLWEGINVAPRIQLKDSIALPYALKWSGLVRQRRKTSLGPLREESIHVNSLVQTPEKQSSTLLLGVPSTQDNPEIPVRLEQTLVMPTSGMGRFQSYMGGLAVLAFFAIMFSTFLNTESLLNRRMFPINF